MTDKLNPQRKKVEIGKRELRMIEILPISIADQFKLSDLINAGVQAFSNLKGNSDDKAFIASILGILQKNISWVLDLVVKDTKEALGGNTAFLSRFCVWRKRKSILEDITNEQAFEIAQIIYEMNYAVLLKKVEDLLEKNPVIQELLSGRSLQQSSEDILNADSKISTEKVSKTGG